MGEENWIKTKYFFTRSYMPWISYKILKKISSLTSVHDLNYLKTIKHLSYAITTRHMQAWILSNSWVCWDQVSHKDVKTPPTTNKVWVLLTLWGLQCKKRHVSIRDFHCNVTDARTQTWAKHWTCATDGWSWAERSVLSACRLLSSALHLPLAKRSD